MVRPTRMEECSPQVQEGAHLRRPRWEMETGTYSPPGKPLSLDAGGRSSAAAAQPKRMRQVPESETVWPDNDPDDDLMDGLTPLGHVPIYLNARGKRVNAKGEYVDKMGRLSHARGFKGNTSSRKWDHDYERVARERNQLERGRWHSHDQPAAGGSTSQSSSGTTPKSSGTTARPPQIYGSNYWGRYGLD